MWASLRGTALKSPAECNCTELAFTGLCPVTFHGRCSLIGWFERARSPRGPSHWMLYITIRKEPPCPTKNNCINNNDKDKALSQSGRALQRHGPSRWVFLRIPPNVKRWDSRYVWPSDSGQSIAHLFLHCNKKICQNPIHIHLAQLMWSLWKTCILNIISLY